MKHFMKICTVFVVLFLILGAGCLIAAFSMGAKFPGLPDKIQQTVGAGGTKQQYQFDRHQIQKLDLEAGGETIRIVYGEDDKIILKNEERNMKVSLTKDGELKIRRRYWGWRFFKIGSWSGDATLILPKDMNFEEISIDCGSGDVTAEGVSAQELSVDCGSGNVSIDRADTRQLELDTGSGDVDLGLTGEKKDYDYEIDCGSGDVNLGDSHFSSTEYKLKEHRGKSIEIDSGSGDIFIEFLGNEGKSEETL